MHTYLLIVLVFLLAAGSGVSAQQTLKGKVYDAGTDSIISAVNIFNATKKNSTRSEADGSYSITAAEGDILIFSASGCIFFLLAFGFDFVLYRISYDQLYSCFLKVADLMALTKPCFRLL